MIRVPIFRILIYIIWSVFAPASGSKQSNQQVPKREFGLEIILESVSFQKQLFLKIKKQTNEKIAAL